MLFMRYDELFLGTFGTRNRSPLLVWDFKGERNRQRAKEVHGFWISWGECPEWFVVWFEVWLGRREELEKSNRACMKREFEA